MSVNTQPAIRKNKSSFCWKKWSSKIIQQSKAVEKFPEPLPILFYAKKYHDIGLPVVPLKILWNGSKSQYDKQPLTEWKRWETERQTDEEYANLNWKSANGFGVILGWKTDKGYLTVVDYDVKGEKATEDVKAKGKTVLELLPETSIERTANNGLHLIYFSSEPAKNNRQHHDTCGLELFGERLVVMAPSEGYHAVNDKPILQVKDLSEIFNNAIKAVGLEKHKKPTLKQGTGKSKNKIRPCVEALLKNNALSHEQRCVVAFEFLNAGYKLDDVLKRFQNQTDFDLQKTKQQLEHAINTGYLPYSEEKLKAIGVCLGPTCEQYGKQQMFTPSILLDDGRIAEEGYDGKDVHYIIYNPETQEITKENLIETENKVYLPIINEDVENGLVKLPSEAAEYSSNTELDEEIKAYLNHWHEQLDPVQRQLDVYYVKESYIKDLLPQIGYRRNLAAFGYGKSTFLEVLGSICYRPFNVAGCSTEAAIRRTFHLWQGTAIIDEADFKDASLYATIVKILNIGFDRKTGYYKCCDENDPTKLLSFCVYGPKVIATRERYRDTALESRCLTFIGRQNINRLPLFRMARFQSEAQEIRNKLLMWRFRNYYKLKEKLAILEEIDAEEKIYGEVIDVRSRVKQIVMPLLLIAEMEEDRKRIIDFAHAFDANLQNLDEEREWQDQINVAIHKLFEGNKEKISIISEISIHRQGVGEYYKLYLFDFANALEIEEPKTRNYWCRGLAKYFKKRTDFPIKIGTNNRAYVLLPKFYVDEMLKRPLPLAYDANSANYANSSQPTEPTEDELRAFFKGGTDKSNGRNGEVKKND